MKQWSIMEHVDIVLHNSIPCLNIKRVSLGLTIPTCKPEKPAPAHDRHLPHGGKHRIPPQHAERAAIILPLLEHQVHHHQKPNLVLGCRGINPLGFTHELGARVGACGQRVVGHHDEPKSRGGLVGHLGLGDFHSSGLLAADNVMEVEVKVAELLLFETHKCWRNAFVEMGVFGGNEGGEEQGED